MRATGLRAGDRAMIRIGITGHQRLDDETTWQWVRSALADAVARSPRPFAGLSSLAIGADQLLASIVLDQDGTLEVVVPFPDYRSRFADRAGREALRRACCRARHVSKSCRRKLPTRRPTWRPENGSSIAAMKCSRCGMVNQPPTSAAPAISCSTRETLGRLLTVFNPVTRTVLFPDRRLAGDSL